MEFNKIWTKEKNNKLRQFIKEKKSTKSIIDYFGEDLKHHPKKKYICDSSNSFIALTSKMVREGSIKNYNQFNEIKINPYKISYNTIIKQSLYKNKNDYFFDFIDNDEKYILIFFYVENFNMASYEILFTTKKQYDEYEKTKNNILKTRKINKSDEIIFTNIIEKETNFNYIISLMKKISYIIFDVNETYKKIYDLPFSITETDKPIKIKLYRNIIKESFENIKEIESKSELNPGKKIFYYEIDN